jgi:hypothetical protein
MVTIIGILDAPFTIYNKCAGQHSNVTSRFALTMTGSHRPDSRFHQARVEKAGCAALFQTIGGVNGRFLIITIAANTGRQLTTIAHSMFRFAQGNGHHRQPQFLKIIFVQLQLSQPLAAKYSTKVTQKGQKDRAIGPQTAHFNGLPLNINYDTGQCRITCL